MSLTAAKADPKWFPGTNSPKMVMFPNITRTTDDRYLGASETAAAFDRTDEWGRAVAAADWLGVFVDPPREASTGTDGYLTTLVRTALQYRKSIIIETGGPYGTGSYPTGATSAARDIDTTIANIVALGGSVGYIQMDHPLQRVMDGLGQTLAQAIDQTVEYMQTMHATYPAIKIGLIDQISGWDYGSKLRYGGTSYGTSYATAFTDLMTDVTAASEELYMLHFDLPYEYANAWVSSTYKDTDNWLARLGLAQAAAVSAGVRTGFVINSYYGGGGTTGTASGAPSAGSDALFQSYSLRYAEQLKQMVAQGSLTQPDHILAGASWYYYPRDLAPDTTSGTLADTFLRIRELFV